MKIGDNAYTWDYSDDWYSRPYMDIKLCQLISFDDNNAMVLKSGKIAKIQTKYLFESITDCLAEISKRLSDNGDLARAGFTIKFRK